MTNDLWHHAVRGGGGKAGSARRAERLAAQGSGSKRRSMLLAMLGVILLGLALPDRATGLIDASLQPHDLLERYGTVLALQVVEIDEQEQAVVLEVTGRLKGKFEPERVRLLVDDEGPLDAFYGLIMPDQPMVAYLDPSGRRNRERVLFYAADGHWGMAERTVGDEARWQWTDHLSPEGAQSMFGVFNGRGDRLAEMMADAAADRYFFPSQPFTRFGDQQVIGALPDAVEGLAVYDVTGDGELDVVAASAEDCRLLVRTGPWSFEDRTDALGLSEARGHSVSVADVDADGRADLLIGGRLYLQQRDGQFEPSDRLPAEADASAKVAAFVELNGDGWPDVVVSRAGLGLAIYLHGGGPAESYRDARAELGLDAIDAVQTEAGYFTPGDWNGDGRTDLFYAVDQGVLLVQDQAGRFVEHEQPLRLKLDGAARWGAGSLAPLWRAGSTDLVVASEASVHVLIQVDGRLVDAAPYGNEITEAEMGLIGALAEDLNADGNVDVYALNGGRSSNIYYMNRGYGSFMASHKYAQGTIFPGSAHAAGARSAVAADIDGDGANDLVLGATDGSIVVLPNRTLASRGQVEHPNLQQRALDRTAILTVTVAGPLGVTGAEVVLRNDAGEVVARRVLGSQVLTGSRGPDAVNLAVREQGEYELSVTWADGLTRRRPVDLTEPGQRRTLTVSREAKANRP